MTALLVAAITAVTPQPACPKTFSGPMIKRAISVAYSGTRDVTRADRAHLRHFIRCARSRVSRARIRAYRARAVKAWRLRRNPQPDGYWLASWYDDSGTTASGWHATYGVAMCGSAGPCYAFGTRILLFYGGRQVTAIVDDHGPYAGGRNIDLSQNTAAALGFGGIGSVGFHVY